MAARIARNGLEDLGNKALVATEGATEDGPPTDATPQSAEVAPESAPVSDAQIISEGALPETVAESDAVAALQNLGEELGLGPHLTDNLGLSDGELIGALQGLDIAGNIDQALDQLTNSPDLFDMPAPDFGDHTGHGDT